MNFSIRFSFKLNTKPTDGRKLDSNGTLGNLFFITNNQSLRNIN